VESAEVLARSNCAPSDHSTGQLPEAVTSGDGSTDLVCVQVFPRECCERVPVPPLKPGENPPSLFFDEKPPPSAFIPTPADAFLRRVRPDAHRGSRPARPLFGEALRASFCIWLN
jgi:hypothetical protein